MHPPGQSRRGLDGAKATLEREPVQKVDLTSGGGKKEEMCIRDRHKVGRAVFAGVCSAQGWKPGKAVPEEEFLEAVQKFENAPMRVGSGKKEVKK